MSLFSKLMGGPRLSTPSTAVLSRYGNVKWMQRQAGGQYTEAGQSAKCAKAISNAAKQIRLPVVVHAWKDMRMGAGLFRYCVNIYYPDGVDGTNWIGEVILPLLYNFSMGAYDLSRLPFASWNQVEEHLRTSLSTGKEEGGRATEQIYFANFG